MELEGTVRAGRVGVLLSVCPCGLPCQGWAWLPASMASPCTPGPRFNFHGVPRDSAVGEAGWSPGPDVELQEAAVAVATAELSGCRAAWLRGRRLQGQEQPTSRHLGWGTTAQHLPVSAWTRSTAVRSSLLSALGRWGLQGAQRTMESEMGVPCRIARPGCAPRKATQPLV